MLQKDESSPAEGEKDTAEPAVEQEAAKETEATPAAAPEAAAVAEAEVKPAEPAKEVRTTGGVNCNGTTVVGSNTAAGLVPGSSFTEGRKCEIIPLPNHDLQCSHCRLKFRPKTLPGAFFYGRPHDLI